MRVVIAEDQVLLREGLARLFEDGGHEVVGLLGDTEGLSAAIAEHEPDLVILDIRMPPTFTDEGARARARSQGRRPELGVLLLSQHIETSQAVELVDPRRLRLPAQGPRPRRRRLPRGGRTRRAGGSALDPKIVASLVVRPQGDEPLASSPTASARCSG